jgi:hypothetical protein
MLGAQLTGHFALSKVCGGELKPRGECTYSVLFAPTVKGVSAGSLTINSNSSSGPRTVTLFGTSE